MSLLGQGGLGGRGRLGINFDPPEGIAPGRRAGTGQPPPVASGSHQKGPLPAAGIEKPVGRAAQAEAEHEIDIERKGLLDAREEAIKRLEAFIARYSGENAHPKATPDAILYR